MADSQFTLYRGAASATSATLFTSPSSVSIGVSEIIITNTTTSSATATVNLGSIALVSSISIAANTTEFIELNQILFNGETITASASTTGVNFHIAGYEVY